MGAPLDPGRKVVVLKLPAGLTDGLPPEEAGFVSGCVGLEAEVSDLDGADVEITLKDQTTGIVHFIVLPGDCLRAS